MGKVRHRVAACATATAARDGLWGDRRDWHCCECGWPTEPCRETWPELRDPFKVRFTGPHCGDDATPYLVVLGKASVS